MTNEERQLLLQDLCARLPYGVTVRYKSMKGEGTVKLGYGNITYVSALGRGWWTECKPYLRPMDSMAEEEFKEWHDVIRPMYDGKPYGSEGADIDFFNKYHFDYRGLIPMGLALEAPKDMYNTNTN